MRSSWEGVLGKKLLLKPRAQIRAKTATIRAEILANIRRGKSEAVAVAMVFGKWVHTTHYSPGLS